MKFLDANIFIRYLADPITDEDGRKHAACSSLFEAIEGGEVLATTSEVVLHEVLHVLCSPRQYGLKNSQAVARLRAPVTLRNFHLPEKSLILEALDIFARHEFLDFSDAWSMVLAQRHGHEIITYDAAFDRVPGVSRHEP